MTKRTLGYSYPIALTISLVPALTPAIVQAAPLTPPPATGILDRLCYDYVPKIEKLAPGKDANAQPVEVDADRLEAKQGGTAVYQGDVKVRQGVRKFDSDYAELDQKSRDVIAIGNIYYNDGQITVTSDKTLKSNLDTKNSELEEGKYQVHGSPVRGSADRVTMTNNNQNITLEGAQYTTCPPGQEVWTLKAAASTSIRPRCSGRPGTPVSGSTTTRCSTSRTSTSPSRMNARRVCSTRVIPRAPRTAWTSPSRSTGT
jgi:LPS-assembly protein